MAANDRMNSASSRLLPARRASAGFTLIEILVALVILLVGLLGLVGLQAKGQQAEMESYQRTQALVLLQDLADRMNANRAGTRAMGYVVAPNAPVGGPGALADCAAIGLTTTAAKDLCMWGNLLRGAAEAASSGSCTTTGTGNACAGAMIGARGCVTYDGTDEIVDSSGAKIAGTGVFTLAIAWQGLAAGYTTPGSDNTKPLSCASGSYGNESLRRVVTSTIRLGSLGNY